MYNILAVAGELSRRAGRKCRHWMGHDAECQDTWPEEYHRWCDRCFYRLLIKIEQER